jgi:phosphoglycolate phosphatase
LFGLIVFDLDGTLVDSRRDIAESANAMLESFGVAPLAEDVIGSMVGDGAPVLVRRVLTSAGLKARDALPRFLDIYHSRLLKHTRPYDGMIDVLSDLAPRVRLAVLTNKPREATLAILHGLGLHAFFPDAFVVAGDEAFPRKPDPAGLCHLVELADSASDRTLLVGDSAIDWRTARAAGVGICLARYGFGWESFTPEELASIDARWTIERPRELLERLSGIGTLDPLNCCASMQPKH